MSTAVSKALRQKIAETAQFRCGYCLTSQHIVGPLLEIDHIISQAKGGTDAEENLWLACPTCNSHKSDRVTAVDAQTEQMVSIFNPRTEIWSEHFEWRDEGTLIHGKTATGRATIAALNMNHEDIIVARRLWVSVGWHPPA
ncbi:MAG: HNH endonuclease signature motif containing protein [Anaerolineae bacterium]|nr:HNH endonuclease signature motif containing protein [Anaerolineae bacterium]